MRVGLARSFVKSHAPGHNVARCAPFARPFIAPGLRLRFIPTQLNAHIVVAVRMKQCRLANRKQNIQHAHILIFETLRDDAALFPLEPVSFSDAGSTPGVFTRTPGVLAFLISTSMVSTGASVKFSAECVTVSPQIKFAGAALRFLSRSVGSRHAQMAACQRNDRAPGMAVHGRRCPRQIVHAQDANLFILKFDFDGISRCRRRFLCPCWQHSQQRHQHRNLYSAHFFPRPSQHIRHRRMLQRFRCVRVLGSVGHSWLRAVQAPSKAKPTQALAG